MSTDVFNSTSTNGEVLYVDSGISPLSRRDEETSISCNSPELEHAQHDVHSTKDVNIQESCKESNSSQNNSHNFEQIQSSSDEANENELYRSLNDDDENNIENNDDSSHHENSVFDGNASNELYFSLEESEDVHTSNQEVNKDTEEKDGKRSYQTHINNNDKTIIKSVESPKIKDNRSIIELDAFGKVSPIKDTFFDKKLNQPLSDDDDFQDASSTNSHAYKKSFDGTSSPGFTHKR